MVRFTDRPAMTIAVDLGRKATKQTNKQTLTRVIWEVLSMVFYLRNRFTNPIIIDIILKNYLSSMLWHKFHKDIIMQTRIISL